MGVGRRGRAAGREQLAGDDKLRPAVKIQRQRGTAPSASAPNDVLKRLMQLREKETNEKNNLQPVMARAGRAADFGRGAKPAGRKHHQRTGRRPSSRRRRPTTETRPTRPMPAPPPMPPDGATRPMTASNAAPPENQAKAPLVIMPSQSKPAPHGTNPVGVHAAGAGGHEFERFEFEFQQRAAGHGAELFERRGGLHHRAGHARQRQRERHQQAS